jgi:ubiquinone/menaquinone biosynthesis C-methylase UbiE
MRLPNARFQQADGGQLPFPDGAFDASFVCDVFSNFPTFADAEALLDELVRVVKPGGRAMAASITDADKADEFQKRVYAIAEELTLRFGPQPLASKQPASRGGLIARLKRSLKGVPQPPKAAALIVNYNFQRSAFDEFARKRGLGVTFFDVHSLNPYLGYRFNVVLTKP